MATAMRSFCCRLAISCDNRKSFFNQSPSTASSLCFSANLSHGIFSKGCLSLDISGRPNRIPVICMAQRYAPNTTRRKRLSRKRGGDPEKKRHRNRKGSRKKKLFKIVRLVSEAGTGFFYATRKSRKLDKLKLKKYDPKVRRHVLFTEAK